MADVISAVGQLQAAIVDVMDAIERAQADGHISLSERIQIGAVAGARLITVILALLGQPGLAHLLRQGTLQLAVKEDI